MANITTLQKLTNHKLLKNKFIKNVSVMMSGSLIAQLITVAIAPVLSRLYESSAFGVYSLFFSIVGMISVIAAFRYELAILLPKDDDEAAHLFVLSILVVLLVTAGSLGLTLLFGEYIVRVLNVPELKPWLIWIPFSIFATGIYQCFNYWSTRRKQFKRVSISQVFRSGGVSSTQTASGLAGFSSSGLIGGQLVGQFIASALLGVQTWKNDRKLFYKNIKWAKLKKLGLQFSEFPKFSTPQTFINAVSQNLPVFMLAMYYDAATVGFYAISLRLMQMPVTLISQSVRPVLLEKFSTVEQGKENYTAQLKKLTGALALIALLPTLIIVLFGPIIFQIIFGQDWSEAGNYARWMVFMLFFLFINPPTMVMITVLGMQKMLLVYECVLLLFRFAALWIGGVYFSPMITIALYSLVGIVFTMYLIGYMYKMSKEKVRKYGV